MESGQGDCWRKKIAIFGNSSWMPSVPQGVKRIDDDDIRQSHPYVF
jgi:hypothetical protein